MPDTKVVLTHDPDDERGCWGCPLFTGVPRDGACSALGGRTLNYGSQALATVMGVPAVFMPAADCPLRTGPVTVRGSGPPDPGDEGPRLVSVELLAEMLPELGPDDDGLAVVAAVREALRAGQRSAARVSVLQEREDEVIEILTGRRGRKP